jgi:hypothetical protein
MTESIESFPWQLVYYPLYNNVHTFSLTVRVRVCVRVRECVRAPITSLIS